MSMARKIPLMVAGTSLCWSTSAVVHASVVPPKDPSLVMSSAFRLDEFTATIPASATTTSVRAGGQEDTSSSQKANAGDVEDEPWRKNKDWWKDPMALFDDNDEYVGPSSTGKAKGESREEEAAQKAAAAAEQEQVAVEKAKLAEEKSAQERAEKEQLPTLEMQQQQLDQQKLKDMHQAEEEERQAQKLVREAAKAHAAREEEQRRREGLELRAREKVQERMAQLQADHERQAQEKAAANALREQERLIREEERKEEREHRELKRLEARAMKRASHESSGVGSNIAVFPLASLAFLPKVSQWTLGNLPVAKLMASVALGKALLDSLVRLYHNRKGRNLITDGKQDLDNNGGEMDLDSEQYDSESETEQRDNSGRGSSLSSSWVSGIASAFRGRPGQVLHGGATSQSSRPKGRPSRAEELEHFRITAERAQMEKQAMENEYEKASFQLQEARAENANLLSQTKYLKAQVRDYEEMMDRTTRNERKKAKVELQRMKQAMLAAMDKEREAMRKELLREKARLNGTTEISEPDNNNSTTQEQQQSKTRRRRSSPDNPGGTDNV